MIKVAHLYKSFGSQKVLQDINLEILRGQICGIVGENGAGKTTLFRCIAGLESYQGVVKSELHPLKHHIGYLSAEPYFFAKMTGREYLRLLCDARKVEVPDLDVKNIFDLPLDRYASIYSTGMKKKLVLTAILLQQNDYFILDEPFNGLDIQSNLMLSEIILRLKNQGKIIMISSHIFSILENICDKIYYLKFDRSISSVSKKDFNALRNEMKGVTMDHAIDKLFYDS